MKNQFVTYNIALKLKELGFNEPCLCEWNISEQTNEISLRDVYYGLQGDWPHRVLFGAPLWQQAIDWLRETHKIYINFSVTIGECEMQISVTDNNPERNSYADTFRLYEWTNILEGKEHAILKAIELIENNC